MNYIRPVNYKNIIDKYFPSKPDNNLKIFALVAGIAAGAVLAALFAHRPGKETRKLLAEKINGKPKDKRPLEIKDHLIDDMRESTREHAEKLQGRADKNKSKDPVAIKVTAAGSDAWKKSSTEKKEKQSWKE